VVSRCGRRLDCCHQFSGARATRILEQNNIDYYINFGGELDNLIGENYCLIRYLRMLKVLYLEG
jgi:hypothetical protein